MHRDDHSSDRHAGQLLPEVIDIGGGFALGTLLVVLAIDVFA
jgi:hypothetical protein